MRPPHHDPGTLTRALAGDLLVFGVNGMALASWLARLPDVRTRLDLTPGLLGLLLVSMSLGAVIGLPSAGRIVHRFGSAPTVRIGGLLALAGLVLAALAVQARAPLPVAMVGLFGFGLGNGVWDVAQNLEGSVIEQARGRSVMPWFHAAFSAGTVAGALLGVAATAARIPVGIHVPAAMLLAGWGLLHGTARFLPAFEESAVETATNRTSRRSAWSEPRTLLIGLMVLAAAFTEGTANDWLAIAFVDGHGTSPALGVLALAVFLVFMTAGRLAGTRVLDRYGRVPVLRALFAAAVIGCVLVVFAGTAGAYLGAAVWGLGASIGFPVGMSAAADDPARAAHRISVVATVGYLAFIAGPPLIGLLGDHFGVLRALLAVGVAAALAFVALPAARPLRPPATR